MGQLLAEVGADKLLWGSEAALMGIPQPYLDALWNLEIPESIQEEYGFPQITQEDKRKILGLNFARLMDVKVPAPAATAPRPEESLVVDPFFMAIQDKLDARVRPILQTHGGDLTLTAVGDGVVSLRFEGACVGCPLRPVTLAVTIEPALRTVEGVEAVEVEGVRLPNHITQRIAASLASSSRLADGAGRSSAACRSSRTSRLAAEPAERREDARG